MDSTGDAVDMKRVRITSDGDKEFECELFEMFIEDCTGRIDALAGAIERGDTVTAAREAHTIKGSSANVGATKLTTAAWYLEKRIREEHIERGDAVLLNLREAYARAKVSWKRTWPLRQPLEASQRRAVQYPEICNHPGAAEA